jgi:transcriptional regulator with XRE-family HTH domain
VEHAKDWPKSVAKQVGQRVAYFRARAKDERGRKLTAQGLSDRCKALGLELGRPTIAKLEKGLRETITVGEVQVLAAALHVSPIQLLFPLGAGTETVQMLPGLPIDTLDAISWFTGRAVLIPGPDGLRVARAADPADLDLYTAHRELVDWWPPGQGQVSSAIWASSMTPEEEKRWREFVISEQRLREIRALMRERGLTLPPLRPDMAWIDGQVGADG